MDAEFINLYIDQLNKACHDLMGRNVILETKLALAEKTSASLNDELQKALTDLEKLRKKKPTTDEF